jgi:hypothetical protein
MGIANPEMEVVKQDFSLHRCSTSELLAKYQ